MTTESSTNTVADVILENYDAIAIEKFAENLRAIPEISEAMKIRIIDWVTVNFGDSMERCASVSTTDVPDWLIEFVPIILHICQI